MTYEHSACPVCGEVFTLEDDVVFCPDCGTPHHRACWKQNGACAFEEKHAEGFVWTYEGKDDANAEQEAPKAELQNCPRCGEPCAADALVCSECGFRFGVQSKNFNYNEDYFLRGVEAEPAEDLGGMTVREVAMFVQHRVPTYVKKFARQKEGDKKIGWNWAAFFFSPFWFFYRKAYKAGLFFLGILMVLMVFMAIPMDKLQAQYLDTIEQYISVDENTTPDQISAALAALDDNAKTQLVTALLAYSKALSLNGAVLFVPNIFAALFADWLYRKKVQKDIAPMRAFAQNDQTFKLLALRRGGVSIFGLLGCYCILSLFSNLVFMYL